MTGGRRWRALALAGAVTLAACGSEADRTASPTATSPVDPPATETPVTETPVTETPVTETPVTETPMTVPVPSLDDVRFEVLAMQTGGEMDVVAAAADQAAFDGLWAAAGMRGPIPQVDLERWVVVRFSIPDDACPPVLVRFSADDSRMLSPEFR